MTITKQTVLGALVLENNKAANVLSAAGIDYCCQGNRTIAEACDNTQIDVDNLIAQLNQITATTNNESINFSNWPLDLLADYIEKKHHRYVQEEIAAIIPLLVKINDVHGSNHPELQTVLNLFQGSAKELTQHMANEESIVFPFVRNLVSAQANTIDLQQAVAAPIQEMMDEHLAEGERFRTIASLTNNYTPPADGCTTYAVTFSKLKAFEQDLHAHIHLENNLLFPKVLAIVNSH